jgi:drug/metabolite transporter (DMT)-like permease
MLLQKKYVGWIGSKEKKSPGYRREFWGWILGFMLMNAAPVPRYFALLGLSANVVSALIGASVAFTAILAVPLIGERMNRRQVLWTVFLFVALGVAGLRGGKLDSTLNMPALYVFFALPLVLSVACVLFRRHKRSKLLAVAFAAVSGAFGGYMVLPMRAVQIATSNILAWFVTPYLYLYILAGIASFVLIQYAYKDGDMSSVSPSMYGLQVLWPALASYAVFGAAFDWLQALSFVAIAVAVFFIARESPEAASTAPKEPQAR